MKTLMTAATNAVARFETWLERTPPQRSVAIGVACLYAAALVSIGVAVWLVTAGDR